MNLYLMRHGIAVSRDDPSFADDDERPLTRKGVKRMRRAARGLVRLAIPFDGILTSPVLRARQTAEIVATALRMAERLEAISSLAPDSAVDHLLFGLTRYQERKHILLVGHQPLLSQTMSALLRPGDAQALNLSVRKGSLCRIEFDALPPTNPGTLHWHLSPKQLRLLGQPTEE